MRHKCARQLQVTETRKRGRPLLPGSREIAARESLDDAKRELETVAGEKDLKRYNGELTDREFELLQREKQRQFEKYRRERKL